MISRRKVLKSSARLRLSSRRVCRSSFLGGPLRKLPYRLIILFSAKGDDNNAGTLARSGRSLRLQFQEGNLRRGKKSASLGIKV